MKSFSWQLARIALLTLVVVSLGAWAMRTFRAEAAPASKALPADGVVVINFHAAIRCNGCREIGRTAQKVVETDFADALKSGRMTWQVINFEEPGHKHFVKDYGIVSSTVVVVRREHGRDATWRRLDAVWDHLFDEPSMSRYLREEIGQVAAVAPAAPAQP